MSMRDRVKHATETAGMFVRVIRQTGLGRDAHPRGLATAARCLAGGGSGPSAIFRVHGATHPDRVAFVQDGRARTFGEMDASIDKLATGLRLRGFERGDSVVTVLYNRPECLEIYAAMSRLGGACVAASWRSTPAELAYIVEHSGARAVFFDAALAPTVEALRELVPRLTKRELFALSGDVAGTTSFDSLHAARAARDLGNKEGAVLIYTSGTTGRPKGAVRKFASGQIAGYFSFLGETPLTVDDKHLAVCPMYHSTGLGFVGMALLLGSEVHVMREFDPEQFLATIAREKITVATLVPTLLYRLLALPSDTFAKYDLTSLRVLFVGGAQLPGPLALEAMERLGPVLYNFYGATETGLVTIATPLELREAPGTIGHAVPGTEIRLLDDDGNVVRRGEVGELYAKNPMLVEGYHADDEATRSSLRDGFFSVGDLATQDAFGRFHIVGRKRDMVISGGVNVYPAEVEAVIESHPAVLQCAVIGVADPEWGERLRAFVVTRPGRHADGRELRAFCKENLAGPKVPREWAFVEALPSNPTGKVLKRELRTYDGPVVSA